MCPLKYVPACPIIVFSLHCMNSWYPDNDNHIELKHDIISTYSKQYFELLVQEGILHFYAVHLAMSSISGQFVLLPLYPTTASAKYPF